MEEIKLKNQKKYLILGIIFLVVAISGCTSNSTKTFDNGKLSFSYPADMSAKEDNSTSVDAITLSKMYSGAMVSTTQYRFGSDFTFDEYVKGGGEGQLTKITVNGKPAYNYTMQNMDGTTSYSTIIDIGNGKAIRITPNGEANAKDQTTTDSYKAYTTIVQTIQIK